MVQFRDARFGYRPDHPVLDSVSFTVARGYVEQNAPAISGTVRENLTLARPGGDGRAVLGGPGHRQPARPDRHRNRGFARADR
ncbi:ABC transporter ATP-binding protein/permease [Rhodococcus sp. JVH1]|uniref:ABC transporter ATP-binding protein/permease n=1 Tax=Rhodococcus sp. JVH1 TaxID=745408 RepID=UPI000271FE21|nr:ABC transporter ATP-binding protein/permease [Rhodococcus sp. JVH1]EJI97788.1 hypothetical protein JVH1_4752 [Rhodococcus sp. JVH1]